MVQPCTLYNRAFARGTVLSSLSKGCTVASLYGYCNGGRRHPWHHWFMRQYLDCMLSQFPSPNGLLTLGILVLNNISQLVPFIFSLINFLHNAFHLVAPIMHHLWTMPVIVVATAVSAMLEQSFLIYRIYVLYVASLLVASSHTSEHTADPKKK